jgi:hypothetical protein
MNREQEGISWHVLRFYPILARRTEEEYENTFLGKEPAKYLSSNWISPRCVTHVTHLVLLIFNVFHVRALYYTKNIKHQQMHKEIFVNYNTLLHVSTLLGHLQGETFRCHYTRLHYTVERECTVDCVLRRLWKRVRSVVPGCKAKTTESSRLQYTVSSTFSLNCIVQPSVTTTESFSLKITQQGRNM